MKALLVLVRHGDASPSRIARVRQQIQKMAGFAPKRMDHVLAKND